MITYKEALELLKTESPVYYKDNKKRKITGVIWRRDIDSLVASVEVLDEFINGVSVVSLNDIYTSDYEIEAADTSGALASINELIEILEDMKSCFRYEDVEKAKDLYNKLMRGSIRLDEEIMSLSNEIYSRDTNDLDYINQIYEDFDIEVGEKEDSESIYENENE